MREVSIQFFKRVQNKIHYAVSGETAAEVIYHRADAEKDFMGLMTFQEISRLSVKRRLQELSEWKELRAMGQLVSGYLDFAERQAEREIPMTMEDWAWDILMVFWPPQGKAADWNGTVSHDKAMDKVQTEYKKYKAKTLSSVWRQDYLNSKAAGTEKQK